jgi:hypothetical protein
MARGGLWRSMFTPPLMFVPDDFTVRILATESALCRLLPAFLFTAAKTTK